MDGMNGIGRFRENGTAPENGSAREAGGAGGNGRAAERAGDAEKGIRSVPDGLWLALDTSTASMTVALAREGRVLAERDSRSERNHSIRLLPEVESLLAEARLAPRDLAGVAVGRGPGSYTGIRIGVTVAKMMAWSLGIPLYAVSSLEALAYGPVLPDPPGQPAGRIWIVPLMDARRGRAYTGLYERGPEGWRCLEEDGVRPMEEWLEHLARRLAETPAGAVRVLFAGDHAAFREEIDAFGSRVPAGVGTDDRPLSASAVAALAWMRRDGCRVDDPHNLFPNYTQLSEPEKKLAAKLAARKA